MLLTKIIGGTAAAVVAAAVVAGPAQAAPSAAGVTTLAHSSSVAADAARKKKKVKIAVNVAPDPAGCYDITIVVTKSGAPVPGAVIKIQSLTRGKWRKANPAVATDANGTYAVTGGGLHKVPSGAASNSKIRVKYKHFYSRSFHAPCAEQAG